MSSMEYLHDTLVKIKKLLSDQSPEAADRMRSFLEDMSETYSELLASGVDFKEVLDALDDSVYVSDAEGKCLYVNPAHERNTTIKEDEVLGRTIDDIIAQGNLFTGGATKAVLETKKKALRLANVTKTNPPSLGYTVGVPIFDDKGDLKQVVVSSRPIISFRDLREDYSKFIDEVNENLSKKASSVITQTSNYISSRLIGSSENLQKVWKTIEMAAPTDATILITGESGVGKEIVADEIYRLSSRKNKAFIKVNCASIPVNLLESELFGYEKGAFSGANSTGKQGLFEMANGGTLLLDEIGDMPMDLQVKLLRAIQSKEITRVGGTKPISLDIRFIASTNSDLAAKMKSGSFRQDLYYRLNVIPVHIPPLRERKEDIDALCDYFIDSYTKKHGKTFSLSESNREILRSYDWPGNIRELENVIEYLTICASGGPAVINELLRGIIHISEEDSQTPTRAMEYDSTKTDGNPTKIGNRTLSDSVQEFEKQVIIDALSRSSSLREAGTILGVNASTLSRKIKQYEIDYFNSKH